MKNVPLLLVACSLLGVTAFGCGDDDADGTKAMDGGPRMDGATAHGGSGGSSGKGAAGSSGKGAAGSSGSGGSSVPVMSVVCGNTTCQSAGGPMGGFVTACCLDAATNTCGVSAMGNPCSAVPEPDPRCPSVNIGGGIFMLASCCTAQGQCGIDATMFGAGCVELAEAAAGAMMQGGGGFMIEFPSPRSCEDFDGGVEDAGR